jgi:tetratricopeptide (TPR) repeat protein
LKKSIENFNFHIEKTSGKDDYIASIKDDRGNKLISNKFYYHPDLYILSRLEDSVGRNIAENAKLIRNFGKELFSSVFAGEILGYYKSHIKDKEHIRLKLFLKKDEPELLRIPWEFMFDGDNFLSALPSISLLRVIEGVPSKTKEKIKGKIRILAIVSSPLDLKPHMRLQVEREQMLILQAVDRAVAANRMEIEFEDEASLRNIQGRLDEEEYHIIHYTGHGVYSDQEDKGYLVLEDDSGNSREVDNETIANLLAGYPSLRLVVLSGCQTAKTSGIEAFRDLSTPLLHKGIPAVISMQYSIADESAMNLAKKLYTEISEETPIDLALTRARKELFLNERAGAVDFATPVLYTDNPDCLLIEEFQPQVEEEAFRLKSAPAKNIVITLEQLGTQFIGRRRELRRIKEDFISRGIRLVILHGIGGIGKTVTATKAAEKLQDYFRGIYTFVCSDGLKIEEILLQLNGFLKRIGVDGFDKVCTSDEPIEMKINYLAQILSQIKLLLIFDNFETLLSKEKKKWQLKDEDLKKGLKALVTQCKNGTCFIFTSRYTFDITDGRLLNILDGINLGELTEPEAIMVMNRFPEIAREDFPMKSEVFQKIGGHPYTINVFAKHAQNKSVKEVLVDIADVTRDMVEFTLLDMSYEMLSSRAKTLIQRISVFKKAFLYEALKWMIKGRGKFKNIDKEVEELIHWGLIIKIEDAQGAFYQVHTLVKDFIGGKVNKEQRKKWLTKAAQFYEYLVKITENLWNLLDAWELYFAAEEYNKAGIIVSGMTKYLHRWGFIELVRRLNKETIRTSLGKVKAAAFHHLGMLHHAQGEYEKAIENYNKSMKINEELGNKKEIASTLHQLGMLHEAQGEYEKAIEKYNLSLKIKEELRDKGGIASTLGQLGNIHSRQGEYDKAIEKYIQSMKIFEKLGDKGDLAGTLHQLGNIHYLQGKYEKAIEKYSQSMKIFEDLKDKGGIAITLHQLGMFHRDQGEYDKAIENYNQSIKINEELGNKGGIASTLHQLGMIHQAQGQYEKAIEKYDESLKIFEELGDKGGIARNIHAIGIIYQKQGEFDEAIKKYEQSLRIYKDLGEKIGIAQILHQLGMIHQAQGEYERAIEKYDQSLKIFLDLGNKQGIASTISQLGRIHEAKKEYKYAMKNYLIALSIFDYLNSPYKKTVGFLLKELMDKIGEEAFEKYYNEVLEELKKEGK